MRDSIIEVETFGCHLRHPLFEGLCLGRGDGLDKAEKLFRISDIRFPHLAISGLHFESVTICHGSIFFHF